MKIIKQVNKMPEQDNLFSWVPAHLEIAKWLKGYRDRQPELIAILKDIGVTGFDDKNAALETIELNEIDPFTFFCYLYKYGSEKRLRLLQELCKRIGIEPIPTSDHGIPSANAQKVWLFSYQKDRNNNEISRLWDFFFIALENKINDENFSDVLKIRNVGRTKLSECLFDIDPNNYFPLNGPTRKFLSDALGIDPKFETYSEYLTILDNIKEKSPKPYYEISYDAWKHVNQIEENNEGTHEMNNRKYWIYAPGEKAYKWDEFFEQGIMGLGWDDIGDLNKYRNREKITAALQKAYNTDRSLRNDSLANYDFKETISIGDVIIAKRGSKEYLGYGIVTSDYYYDNNRIDYQKCRKINWINKGVWIEEEHQIVQKTLTDITKYPDYVERLKKLIGIESKEDIMLPKKESRFPINLILYGPPGTGKTYNTVNKALEIIGVNIQNKGRSELLKIFDEKTNDGQIAFTTFHQSMTYEDFIEGIKPMEPDKEENPVIYKVQPGIFREMCIKASFAVAQLMETAETKKVLDFSASYDIFVDKLEDKLAKNEKVELETKAGGKVIVESISPQGNIIIKHIDGIRSYTVSKNRLTQLHKGITDLNDVNNINKQFKAVIGGSNSSAYWSVLNAIRKEKPQVRSQDVNENFTFEEMKEVVLSLKRDDYKNRDAKNYVLVIDEINRGNISQIFGELITLIEEDKRLGRDEALEVLLPYSREKFGVPSNLYILATMNTADRSVEALDAALRRRFSFEFMPPLYNVGGLPKEIDGVNIPELLSTINMGISYLLDEDHQIGHSYFMKITDANGLRDVFKKNVIPLLKEYFYNDLGKIYMILGENFVEMREGIPHFAGGSNDEIERTTYHIKEINDLFPIIEAAKSIIGNKQ